jgi:hypothetical protein
MHNFRMKWLFVLAEDALPTKELADSKPVAGNPQPFNAITLYPGMITAFSHNNANIIAGLANILNIALYYSSNGQKDLMDLKNLNFIFDTSAIPSVDLKNLMSVSKQFYNLLLTDHGLSYEKALSKEEIKEKVTELRNSQFLVNLSSTNTGSLLSSKIGGNVKNIINNYLLRIS